jgi:imidazolonepropionase-like amidohydrolase
MNNENLSIYAGWLIDGSGEAVQSKLNLDLVNGTIQSIRKMADPVPNPAKSDIPVLDFSDCTLLPGLFDCHVHLAMSPSACPSSSAGPAAEAPNRRSAN